MCADYDELQRRDREDFRHSYCRQRDAALAASPPVLCFDGASFTVAYHRFDIA